MTQAVPESFTLEEFLDWYSDGESRYELRYGVPVKMREQVGGELAIELSGEIRL